MPLTNLNGHQSCINFKEGHVHPACIFNRSPRIRPQARLNAAPDSISCIPNLETSSAMFPLGSMRLLNSSPSSAVKETPSSRVEMLARLRLSDTTNKRIFETGWLRQELNEFLGYGNWTSRPRWSSKIVTEYNLNSWYWSFLRLAT